MDSQIKIAPCGLVCSRCDAYRATQLNAPEKLELVAAKWREVNHCRIELYHPKYSYLDIHPLQIAQDGSARQDDHHGGWFEFKTTFFTRAFFVGRWIPCLSLDAQRLFHTGYEPREKDLLDMQILDALNDAACQ